MQFKHEGYMKGDIFTKETIKQLLDEDRIEYITMDKSEKDGGWYQIYKDINDDRYFLRIK